MKFQNRHFLVMGAGRSGVAAAKVLIQEGATVTLNDEKRADEFNDGLVELKKIGVQLVLGYQDETVLQGITEIILSPGIPVTHPLVLLAEKKNISVLSEVELAYNLAKAPIFAVTGTNGKTTTTSLIGAIFQKSGRATVVGGNIGTALSSEIREIPAEGAIVAEISSFQLEKVDVFHPHVAAILNLTPDHLDRHGSMEIYRKTKERIYENQELGDFLVLNYDDPIVREMAKNAKGKILYFSRKEKVAHGAFIDDGNIVFNINGKCQYICALNKLQIKGGHNVENALAAVCVARAADISPGVIEEVLAEFAGVEHRIELVDTIHGVPYYNDSKATNPESTIKALESFPSDIVLIAGGRDKNTDLTEMMGLVKERVSDLILIGEAAERFEEAAKKIGFSRTRRVANFADAVKTAYSIARKPAVVLLSPACASYDMFDNYEQRGKIFKEIVATLHTVNQ